MGPVTEEPVYVVDIFREIVAKVSGVIAKSAGYEVQYMVGHYTEIRDKLISQTKNRAPSYPLICLFQDFVEERGVDYYANVTLQMMILYNTKKDDYTEERYEKVFKPILYPIYQELIKQISRKVVGYSEDRLRHEKIDRPHWGNPKMYGNDGYLLNDILDGIEIRNLKITLKQNCI